MAVDLGNAFDYFNFSDEELGIPSTEIGQETLANNELNKAIPILASEDIAARNVGVPQDNRFTGILRNTVARPLLFQAGASTGLKLGQLATGTFNPLFALAGAIGSQFLPLDRRPSNLDYQYVNDPNNMGGLRVVDNKIIDPSGILSGKNFASGFGSNSLATMYEKEIDRLGGFITDLEDEEELTEKEKARLGRLTDKRQIARNRLQDLLASGQVIPGTNMTRQQFAFDYNRGLGQFAMPTQDSTGKTLDYTGESDTYAGGETTTSVGGQDITSYDDPYDPGGGE